MQLKLQTWDGRPWIAAIELLQAAGYPRNDRVRRLIQRMLTDHRTDDAARDGVRGVSSTDGSGIRYRDYLLDATAVEGLADTLVGRYCVARRAYLREIADWMRAKQPMAALPAPQPAVALPIALPASAPALTLNGLGGAVAGMKVPAKFIRAITRLFERWDTTPAHEQAWLAKLLGLEDAPVDAVRRSFTAGSLAAEHGISASLIGKLLKRSLHVPDGMIWLEPTPTPISEGVYRTVAVRHYDFSLKDAADALITAHKMQQR